MNLYHHKVHYYETDRIGIICPVTAIECKYKSPTTFADEIVIRVSVEEFKGVKLKLKYEMNKIDGTLICEGHSEHCFFLCVVAGTYFFGIYLKMMSVGAYIALASDE